MLRCASDSCDADPEGPKPRWTRRKPTIIAVVSVLGIIGHLVLRFGLGSSADAARIRLLVTLVAGGEALESYALSSASSVLAAPAKRMPSVAHRKQGIEIADVVLSDVAVGDSLVIFPHDICPVDGAVLEGHGSMDESYLTGEPFQMTKTIGSAVLSGAINGESALTIRAGKVAADSRYAKIMEVMRDSEAKRPHLQRLGDHLGAIYTPVALTVAAWPGR